MTDTLPSHETPVLWPYRSPEAVARDTRLLTQAAQGTVTVLEESVQGRPILAATLPCPRENAPSVLVCANIHGIEFISTEVALGILDHATREDSAVAKLRASAHLWIVPSLNPDGYARTWRQAGRGELSELRTNARGVDLNRNFPRPASSRSVWWNFGGWRTGSDDPQNAFYRGSAPFSEPETRAIQNVYEHASFVASANLHSTMGTVIPPCVNTQNEYRQYAQLIRAFSRGQPRCRYKRLANRFFDRFTGEQEDYQHHEHGTWAICVEHYPIWKDSWRLRPGQPLFWRFNPRNPSSWVDNDIPGILAYFRAVLSL